MERCPPRPFLEAMNGSSAPIGRKKLVPALNHETKCDHAYDDDGELSLEVECANCPGAQDLANDRCLAGILQIIATEAKPEALVLKRHIHRRYRGPTLRPVLATAADLAALNRVLSARWEPSDSRCRTCDASTPELAARIRVKLLDRPTAFMEDRRKAVEGFLPEDNAVPCGGARACVARAFAFLTGSG